MTKTVYPCRPKQSRGGWTAATLADQRTCRKNFFEPTPGGFLSLGVPLAILGTLSLAVANHRVGSFVVATDTQQLCGTVVERFAATVFLTFKNGVST